LSGTLWEQQTAALCARGSEGEKRREGQRLAGVVKGAAAAAFIRARLGFRRVSTILGICAYSGARGAGCGVRGTDVEARRGCLHITCSGGGWSPA
jgi:hypothetical protein